MKRNQRTVGSRYEQEAAAFLTTQGLTILEQNFRCRAGEIDIIAREGQALVFCEVKYRYDGGAGDPAAAVDGRKQQTIFRVAQWYMQKHCLPEDTPCRFDVVALTGVGEKLRIRWIPDAFGSW
ncbi:MAG: YraN family protein [Lachnospiraceae bacterium]|nr:YraN family protein [Lachnospiraceae bacterium]